MSWDKITLCLSRSATLIKLIFAPVLILLMISVLAACNSPTSITQTSQTSTMATTQLQTPSTPTANTTAPTAITEEAAKPQGELFGALANFGNENWLPWLDPGAAPLHDLFYDMLIYYDVLNHKFLPGLAESWEVTPDGLTLTYHFRKGVKWQDGWGEFSSDDVKFNFEMQASPKSVGKVSQCRRIASMDTPDTYTLIVHFKDPYPTFYVDLSYANSAVCQGIVCKKYFETVGEDQASQKPVSTGPYKLLDSQLGSYYKFEALDSHWRVVPEFKYLTVRFIPEISTLVAALKNKEIDAAINVPADKLKDLETAGVAVETTSMGGGILMVAWGGLVIPEDKRYDPTYHNKDPWVDPKVRKAMAISIDREAICKTIYAGFADPVGVPLVTKGSEKYQYPYDTAAAKQLLTDAGYPNGFSFNAVSFMIPGIPEMPRVMEALVGYWQEIGLDPKITSIDYNTYTAKNIHKLQTAGDISLGEYAPIADMLSRAEFFLMPNALNILFEDEGSYAIYRDNSKASFEERDEVVAKLNQYYYDNIGPIPVVRNGYCYAWNPDKILPFPHSDSSRTTYFEYVRHVQPLNTFRLFTPTEGR